MVPLVAVGAGIYGKKLRIVSKQVQDALAVSSEVAEVIDHPQKGLTAIIAKNGLNDTKEIGKTLNKFIYPWEAI